MRNATATVLVFAVTVVSGCEGGTEQPATPAVSEVEGVLHVRLPSRDLLNAPQWRLREIYNTSAVGSDVELFRVVGARFLGDGTLVVANGGTRELLHLNSGGGLERTFGGAGSGPGEFSMMATLDVDSAGNLIVYDRRHLRLTRMTSAGNVLETERLSSEDAVVDLHPLAELTDGRIVAVFGAVRVFGRSGESRDTIPLIVVDPSEVRWDTLGTWPAQEWAYFEFPGGATRTEVGFGRTLAYSGRGGRVALGSTDSLNVAVFDDAGHLAMQIVGWSSGEAVGADEIDRWRTDLLDRRSQASDDILNWLSNAPRRATYPAFQDLLVDDGGRIWIGMFPRGDSQDWLVVGADGQLKGQLTLRADSKLLDATAQNVAVLRRSSMDEEFVAVMAIDEDG